MFGWTGVHVGVVWSELLLLLCTTAGLFPPEFARWVSSESRVKPWFSVLVRLRSISNHSTMFKNCRSSSIRVLLSIYRYSANLFTVFGSVLGWILTRSLVGWRRSLGWSTRRSHLPTLVGILSGYLSLNHVILWRFQILVVSHKILICLSIHYPICIIIYSLT